jgi:hypothetical protein
MVLFALVACMAARPVSAPPHDPAVDVARARHESIRSLERLLGSPSVAPQQRPELMLRLAELYRDEARAIFLAEQAVAH